MAAARRRRRAAAAAPGRAIASTAGPSRRGSMPRSRRGAFCPATGPLVRFDLPESERASIRACARATRHAVLRPADRQADRRTAPAARTAALGEAWRRPSRDCNGSRASPRNRRAFWAGSAAEPDFAAGEVDTGLIDRTLAQIAPGRRRSPEGLRRSRRRRRARPSSPAGRRGDPWRRCADSGSGAQARRSRSTLEQWRRPREVGVLGRLSEPDAVLPGEADMGSRNWRHARRQRCVTDGLPG